jgi:transposase
MSKTAFKDLTSENIEYIKHVYYQEMLHVEKMEILSKKFNIGERTVRDWWQKLDLKKISSNLPIQLQKAQNRVLNKSTKVLLVTTAQNKTALNKDFLSNLIAYKNYITNDLEKETEIVIIPSRYRNPTNNIEDEKTKSEDWWEDQADEFLFYGKLNLGDTLISCDSHISPTAKNPADGYEILAEGNHVVLGHTKNHFSTLPRFRGEALRAITTTGSITTKNYSKSKSGEHGSLTHTYGFVVVELKDKDACYIPRNVKVKSDGSFIDLIYDVKNNTISKIKSSLGFVWGDIHAEQINKDFLEVTKSIVLKMNPEKSVLHDVFDGATINVHESKDMFLQRLKITQGKHLLENEVKECLDLIEDIKGCCGEVWISESNHDNFLTRHIDNENWKKDLHNSPAYLKYALISQTVDLRDYGNILGYLIYERFGDSVKYMKMGDSFYIADYQVAAHGDFSSNGAKGATRGFSRLNLKLIHAHSHSPKLHNNVTCVGVTANINQYYNRKGLSSWAYAHSVIHNNGKNQLLVFNDDYTLSGLI